MKRLAYVAILALGISAPAFTQKQPVAQRYANLPMNFEQNVGQTDGQAQFISHGKGYMLFLSPNQAILKLHDVSPSAMNSADEKKLGRRFFAERARKATRQTTVVRMKLLGANRGAQLVGMDKLSGTANYFIGGDSSNWQTGVPLFAKVQSSEVFPGIDVVYYGNEKRLEYDFVVKPGADPNAISLGFDGIQGTSLDKSGDLSMTTDIGGMNLNKPVVYQMIGGQRKEVAGKYALRGGNAVGFEVTNYDKTQPLIIDPVLVYSTYLGGSGGVDGAYGIAVDSTGDAYVVGITDSTDFPIVGTSLAPAPNGNEVAFVSKFNSTGTALIYSTYLGGNGGDWGSGIALDANGSAYVVGQTGSSNFPVTSNAYQTTLGSGASQNAFVSKLSADGQSLLYSTYLGGGGYDQGIGIALDANQNAYVSGYTTSGSPNPFPTTANAFQSTLHSNYGNGFISRIDTTKSGSNSLIYSTFLGGSGNWDQTNGIAVDANQNVYVGGMTSSSDFPLTASAYQTVVDTYNGTGFLTQIDTTKSGSAGLIYSTVIEGETYAAGVALDGTGKVYATAGYVAKFDTTKSGAASLLYFTRVGGSRDAFTYSIVVDPNGDSYVSGWTWSSDLPVTSDAIQSTLGSAGQNAFVTALSANGSTVLFGTYLGGNGGSDDFASGIAVDPNYNMYVSGFTQSSNFQTTSGAIQTSLNGAMDGFVLKFSPLNVPVITSVSPATGLEGAAVTINGENFGSSQGNSTVTFANGVTAQVTNWTATSISVTVPSGATTGNVIVTVSGNPSNGANFCVLPNIASLSPSIGFPGTPVTITGTGFGATQGTSIFTLNGTAISPSSWSDTQIVAAIPGGASSGNVAVTTPGGASNGVPFTVIYPMISALSEPSGTIGMTLIISGSNFGATQGSSTVTFNGTAATPTSWNSSSIVVTVPTGTTTGNVIVTVSGAASNGVAFSVYNGYPNGYQFRRAIEMSHTNVPNTDQTDFPVLISGTYSYLATIGNGGNVINSNGYDIVFSLDPEGANKLDHEIDSYNSATGASNFWVRIPTLSHTVDTVIYAFYGNPNITTSQENKSGVWRNGYAGTWHFTNFTDSLGVLNATNTGSVQIGPGKIGTAAIFAGSSSSYLTFPNVMSISTSSVMTQSMWVQLNSVPTGSRQDAEMAPAANANQFGFSFQINGSSFAAGPAEAGVADQLAGGAPAVAAGTWHRLTLVLNAGSFSFYQDGALIGTQVYNGTTGSASANTGSNWQLGAALYQGGQYFYLKGAIDDVNISSVARSADWITTEYNNQVNPGLFYQIGAGGAPYIAGLSPTSGPSGTLVTITGGGFGTTQGTGAVTFNGTTATPTSWGDSQITVAVPSGATPGDVVVTISGAASNGVFFMVPTSWSNGYAYRRAITINHARVPNSDQTDFPVLVSGAYDFLATTGNGGEVANANGYDIIFTSDPEGASKLDHEIDSYNSVNGTSSFWVRIPTLSHTADTIIYMFYGNPAVTVSQENKAGVWRNHYLSVFHLGNGTTVGTTDSGSAGYNLSGSATAVTGKIGGGVSFNGNASTYLNHESVSAYPSGTSPVTLEAWFQLASTSSDEIFGYGANSANGSRAALADNGTVAVMEFENMGVNGSQSYDTNWHHLVGVYNGGTLTTGSALVYLDGVLASNAASGGTPNITTNELKIGGIPTVNFCCAMNGAVDEVRVSSGVRSADWIATEFNNQSSPSTFYALESSYTGANTVSPTITNLSQTSGVVGTSVTITGTDFGSTQGSSTVTFNGTAASPTSWSSTSIVTTVPTNAAGIGYVLVSSSGTSSNGAGFTVVPVMSGVSATTGSIGWQVTISGTGFGPSQGSSQVLLNGAPVTINSWSATSIQITIPVGATSGQLLVSTGTANNSNSIYFSITANPLPTTWLDQDVGSASGIGNATFLNGTFTANGFGGLGSTTDAFHFLYHTLSGDGTITARVVSMGGSAGVMIRESLAANSTYAGVISSYYYPSGIVIALYDRVTAGGSYSSQSPVYPSAPPYWVRLTRSGNTFTGYASPDDINWTQLGSSITISMAQNVYIGLMADGESSNNPQPSTFDNVSFNSAANPAPVITSLSATTGPIGSQVVIYGSNFGVSQNGSMVTLSGVPLTVNSWSDTSITTTIAQGAVSGYMSVAAAPSMNGSNVVRFTVTTQPLPPSWLDQDIGTVSANGSATFSNGTFTVNGIGEFGTTADTLHFVYQPLSGDGTIVARVVNTTGIAGVMIRETLATNSTHASMISGYYPSGGITIALYDRTTTGADNSNIYTNYEPAFPYWVKLTRSGNNFTSYVSPDGENWTSMGSSVTINMAQNVYFGTFASGESNSSPQASTFDNVSVNTTANPAPAITGLSATTGTIGSQVVISGSNFGASQGSSIVALSGVPMTVNSWSDTSITITIASGAVSGYMGVAVAPTMNASNVVQYAVTTQPLPSGWLDQDVGTVGTTGNAGYSGGTFTINGFGGLGSTSDTFHFAYLPLSGDGTIVARVVSTSSLAGVMIRESLATNSTYASVVSGYYYYGGINTLLYDRATTGGNGSLLFTNYEPSFPYWVKLTRSGNTFSGYASPDGVYWTQVGTSVTISMAQNVYIGLMVEGESTSNPQSSSFDNVSFTAATPYPTPNITGISPANGGPRASITISGSSFGATQGSSALFFNGASMTSITSWSDTQIVVTMPSTTTTGPVSVVVNGIGSNKNVIFTFYNPAISSLTPSAGPVGGTIIISGSGFGSSQNSSTVQFNGIAASTISSWSDTSITANVPSSTTSGPVTVTEGTVTSGGSQFTVIEAATITGLSPSSGPTGSSVVITGTGFGPTQSDSTVSFYAATATTNIVSWSDTSITATVPVGTVTGHVSVTVAGITVTGPVFTLTLSSTLTDSLGNMTTYASEILGGQYAFVDSQGSGCSTCTVRGNSSNTFDSLGNILTTTDPAGHVVTNTYDSSNNLHSQSVQLNSTTAATTTYTYNAFGEVLTVTDSLGNVTTNTYDSHGNLLSVTSPAPNSSTAASVTTFAYNSLGELTTITDPLSHATTMTYTPAGLIATITDAQNNVTTYGYDAKGNRTSVKDALSHTTTFAYDAMSRLTTITYPDSTTTAFTYDVRGRRTSVTDQNGKTTSYAYDDADRLTSVTDAASHVTNYAYDTEDNLTSITDASSNQTAFTYDAFGRVTQTNFPSSLSENYQYDADNNLTQKTDRKGQTIQYLYDALNRLTQKTYPDTTNVEYTYDLVGKILQVNDPTGTYAFSYDNMGRLIGTTTSYSFLTSRNFTNAYTYDATSNRTGFTDPESGSTAYSYDTLNRLTSLAPPSAFGSGSFGFSYDALSRRTQMTRPNNVATNYTYDNLSRLTSVLHQLSGSTIDGASYTLDSAGNRTSKTDQLAAVTSNYTYDPIYQLTQVTQANNTTESYSYDAVGNRTASLGVSSYTTNASNELTATSNASYTYDSNGNTLTKVVSSNTTSYTWDFENRLTSVTLPGSGGTVSFKYDPMGRRIYKSVSTGGTSVFAYDGETLTEETNSSGSVVARYVQGQDIDESLAMLRSSTTSYYHADGLGSVTSLSNGSGAVAQTYSFDSFGKTTPTGSLVNPFQYTGRELDSETGLYDYRARYYDPTSGRFLSEDPIQFDGGINFYAYTANDPAGLVDPSGMSPAQGNANGYWPPANLDDPALSPIAHYPWPSSGRFYGVGQGPTGGQQCVALTRHFTSLPCTDCWRVGPKVIGNTIPAGTAIATFDKNGRYPQSGNANSGLYVATYPGNKIVIVDQWPPNAVTHGPAKPAGARTLGPAPGDPSDDSGSYSVITVPRGTQSSHCKCGNW